MATASRPLVLMAVLATMSACLLDRRTIGTGELKRRRANEPAFLDQGPYIETWSVSTAAGRAVKFISSDAPTYCSDIGGYDRNQPMTLEVSAAALHVGDVTIVAAPLDRATPAAAVEPDGYGITAGTLTLTQLGDPMVGSFHGTGPGGEIIASFRAVNCD
jgi:hypothetical protein